MRRAALRRPVPPVAVPVGRHDAVEWVALEAARLRLPEAAAGILGAEPNMIARRARRRRGVRAGALPRGDLDHAAVRVAALEAVAVGSESLVAAGAAAAAMG